MRVPPVSPKVAAIVALSGFYASIACVAMRLSSLDVVSPSTFHVVVALAALLAPPTFALAMRPKHDGRAALVSVAVVVCVGALVGLLATFLTVQEAGTTHVLSLAGSPIRGRGALYLLGSAFGGFVSVACAFALVHVVAGVRAPPLGFDQDARLLVPTFGVCAVAAGLAAALANGWQLLGPALSVTVAWVGLVYTGFRDHAHVGLVGRVYRGVEPGVRLVRDADQGRLAAALPAVALTTPELLVVCDEAGTYRKSAFEEGLFVLTEDEDETLGPLRARVKVAAGCGLFSLFLLSLRILM
jgi:hypothetical protein